jgi:hypothetical protein
VLRTTVGLRRRNLSANTRLIAVGVMEHVLPHPVVLFHVDGLEALSGNPGGYQRFVTDPVPAGYPNDSTSPNPPTNANSTLSKNSPNSPTIPVSCGLCR